MLFAIAIKVHDAGQNSQLFLYFLLNCESLVVRGVSFSHHLGFWISFANDSRNRSRMLFTFKVMEIKLLSQLIPICPLEKLAFSIEVEPRI